MRYIEKKSEPNSLTEYRQTPGVTYEGVKKDDIQQTLVEEQRGLCAYCMKRIKAENGGRPTMIIEHYIPRNGDDGDITMELDYSNMLGVCIGNKGRAGELHCDQSKKDMRLKVLDPLKREVEGYLGYAYDGKVFSVGNNPYVKADIALLNLNESFLKENRRRIIMGLQEGYKKEVIGKTRAAKNRYLKKQLKLWTTSYNNVLQPFCQVAINWIRNKQEL